MCVLDTAPVDAMGAPRAPRAGLIFGNAREARVVSVAMEELVAGLGLTTPELQRCVIERIEHTENQLLARLNEGLPAKRVDNIREGYFYNYDFTIECPPNLLADKWHFRIYDDGRIDPSERLKHFFGINLNVGDKLDTAVVYEMILLGHLEASPTITVYVRWARG